MKISIKRYLVPVVSALTLLCASCSGIGGTADELSERTGDGTTAIRISLSDTARTANPVLGDETVRNGYTWKLYSKAAEQEAFTLRHTWKQTGDNEATGGTTLSETPYTAMLAATVSFDSNEVQSWTFKLTAERMAESFALATFTAETAVTITPGSVNTVGFAMKLTGLGSSLASEHGTGSIEIPVSWIPANVAKVRASLHTFDLSAGTVATDPVAANESTQEFTSVSTQSITYTVTAVPEGTYVAKFQFYDSGNNPLTTDGWWEYVTVVNGLTSKPKETIAIKSLDDVYTITYVPAPVAVGNYTLPGSFTRNSGSVTLPDASNSSVTGYLFCGWYNNDEYTGGRVTSIDPAETRHNVTLYGRFVNAAYASAPTATLAWGTATGVEESNLAQVGNTLTATVTYAGEYEYTWETSTDGSSWSEDADITEKSVKMTAGSVDKRYRLVVTPAYKVVGKKANGDTAGEGETIAYYDDATPAPVPSSATAQVACGNLVLTGVTTQYSGTVLVGNKPQRANLILSGVLKDVFGNTITSMNGSFDDNASLASSASLPVAFSVDGYSGSATATVYVTVQYPPITVTESTTYTVNGNTVTFTDAAVSSGWEFQVSAGEPSGTWTAFTADNLAVTQENGKYLWVRKAATGTAGSAGYIMASTAWSREPSWLDSAAAEASSTQSGKLLNELFRQSPYKYAESFRRTTTAPTGSDDAVRISPEDTDSEAADVWAWISADNTLYVYSHTTEGAKIPLNADSSGMFSGMTYLETIDLTGFDTSNVTNMSEMFQGCYALTSITWDSELDTSSVRNMSHMFEGTALTSIDLSGFVTSAVTTMASMFEGASVTSLDLSSFDTRSVTDFSSMFAYCRNLSSITLGEHFTGTAAITLKNMFKNCTSLEVLDISGFTSTAPTLDYMFANMTSLVQLNISGLAPAERQSEGGSVSLNRMFSGDVALTKIYVASGSNWSSATGTYTFDGCSNLVGGAGSVWSNTQTGATYARVDSASAVGYFTVLSSGSSGSGSTGD